MLGALALCLCASVRNVTQRNTEHLFHSTKADGANGALEGRGGPVGAPGGSAQASRTSGGSSLRLWGKWRTVVIIRSRSSTRRTSPALGCCHSDLPRLRLVLWCSTAAGPHSSTLKPEGGADGSQGPAHRADEDDDGTTTVPVRRPPQAALWSSGTHQALL